MKATMMKKSIMIKIPKRRIFLVLLALCVQGCEQLNLQPKRTDVPLPPGISQVSTEDISL